MVRNVWWWVFAAVIWVTGCEKADLPQASDVKIVPYSGAGFSVNVPEHWQVYSAGQCSEQAFVAVDPDNGLRRFFHFGSVGPFYMSPAQKQIDIQYMQMGGLPVQWAEMPVIQPLTPDAFVSHFARIANTRIAQQFMPQVPRMTDVQIVSTKALPSPITGGSSALIRAVFIENGQVGEGLFTCSVAPFMPFTGGPGGGTAYGYLFSGITAPVGELAKMEPLLSACLGSYIIPQSVADACIRSSQGVFKAVAKAGRTLSETSDMIMKGWESRNRVDDILAERRSDGILGFNRLYDPQTGETYHVDHDFLDRYEKHPETFDMNNLEALPPDSYDLWTRAPLPQREIH